MSTPCIICSGHAWCPGQHLSSQCWKPCTVSACLHGITHTPNTFTNWQGISTGATHITHENQNILHTSKSAMVPADHPSLIWHTYGIHSQLYNDTTCSPMIIFHVRQAVTLFFETFLCTCQEVDNSKYGIRNTSTMGSTTAMNKDMPLILNKDKSTHFVKPVNLYHEKGRLNNHRTGSIK